MKGHTTIELTDVNTGKVEVFEDDNIITNAAALYTALFSTYYNNGGGSLLPLTQSTFGGIKLFGGTLEENPDNFYLPSVGTAPIIGYASKETSPGTDPYRGSRNINETKEIDNGVQIVWDFATSEANGTIGCVCLTTSTGGESAYYFNGMMIKSGTALVDPLDSMYEFVDINHELKTAVFLYEDADGCSKLEYKLPVVGLLLSEKFNEFKLVSSSKCNNVPSNIRYYRNGGDGKLYRITQVNPIKLNIYDILNDNFTNVTLDVPNISPLSPTDGTNGFKRFAVSKGSLYLIKNSLLGYYKIDMANPSNVQDIILPKFGEWHSSLYHISILPNDDVLVSGYISDPESGEFFAAYPNYNKLPNNYYPGDSGVNVMLDVFNLEALRFVRKHWSTFETSIFIDQNLLMSINNLQTPVIKTADKTMKITYTLLYEEEVPV